MDIIVVDDERIALENLIRELNKAIKLIDFSTISDREGCREINIHSFRSATDALDYSKCNNCDIAFVDVEMKIMTGIELAQEIKELHPRVNVIFTTAHAEYMEPAFSLHASGYCLKPITAEKLIREIENLRHQIRGSNGKRLQIKTFGNFEAFVDGTPIHFKYSKSKELLAYLIDRNGAMCTNREVVSVLWEDDLDDHFSYLKKIRGELISSLTELNCSDVIVQHWGSIGIVPDKIDCDYFKWLCKEPEALSSYHGEYMTQYAWSEYTHGLLEG